ncbi:hypothetical protein, conserved [Babesia ovata]|uniref:6-Cys domain-containing protein n=1 Tax=Babesia ovata TaxID=189622 RepID=A0A2H6KID6_9APIC|nr:uncharacterized protein BOVATA_042340 [Babesia ovata]GBE62741.1 hypothetical protein, conserved [Babesia ovata]
MFISAKVICPRQVNDAPYIWYPRPISDKRGHINTYVTGDGKFRSVPISDVMRSESGNAVIRFESNVAQTELHYKKLPNQLIAMTERRLIFICGPRDLVLSDALQRHLERLNGIGQMKPLPWASSMPVIQEIKKMGTGLGVLFLNRGHLQLPLQGCGSRPSPLFAADNEVYVDSITGTRSCVADPMGQSRIGFVCEGRLEPDDCMRSLLDKNDQIVTAPKPYSYRHFDTNKPWVVTQFFSKLALPPFNGECRCINPETGQVKAKIEILSKTEYICDIASKAFLSRFRPIHGPWCSVMLHPGSTLTIKLPTPAVKSVFIDQDYNYDFQGDFFVLPFSQLASIYEYESEFLPKDVTTLRQLKSIHDINAYDEILYHKGIAGDALELDVSRMPLGEVKLKYQLGKPLALRERSNSFFYHWTLISRNENVPDKIRAAINVSFAFSHSYWIIGCDRGRPSVFDPESSNEYCSIRMVGNGIGGVYECLFNQVQDRRLAGIHCRADEVLLPNNCESVGYDLVSNQIIPMPESMKNATIQPTPGFQVFDIELNDDSPVSYACICVDERGYETSRLIVESTHREECSYAVSRDEVRHTFIPYILLQLGEAGVSNGGAVSSQSLMLYNVLQKSILLGIGTTLRIPCGPDQQSVAGNGRITTTWLPKQPEEYHYTVNQRPHGPELIRKSHNESFASTPGALEIGYQENGGRPEYKELTIKSRKGAILISKDPLHKKFVPMTFLCGNTPEQSDLPVVIDGVSTSAASPPPNVQGVKSSAQYTWNIVEVAVETTDPYMQGCGVTYESTDLFKPETHQLYDADGQLQFGCKIDLHMAKEAAFYCPAPYVLDPPNCFSQVSVDGTVKNTRDISQSLVTSQSNHFMILYSFSGLVGPGEKLRQTPPLECRCVTTKGIILSTIQIENYYAK